jgi:hypothetical protein
LLDHHPRCLNAEGGSPSTMRATSAKVIVEADRSQPQGIDARARTCSGLTLAAVLPPVGSPELDAFQVVLVGIHHPRDVDVLDPA